MTKDELKSILDKHGKWVRGEEGGSGAYLSGADLSGAYLSRANLSRADLSRADLSRADLSGADLSRADLSGADLSGAYLSDADLSRAYLSGAYLSRAYLSGADLSGAYLSGAYLSGAYLSRAYLSGADLRGADLSGAYLSRAYLSGADLSGADLRGAYLSGADLSGADLRGTMLERINWLAWIGIMPNADGKGYGYKMTDAKGLSPIQTGNRIDYLATDTFAESCDTNPDLHCGSGINLANLQWCLNNKSDGYRLFLMEFTHKDAVCPRGSDGKFRVPHCRRVTECDWNGNIIEANATKRDSNGRFAKKG